MRPTCSKMQKDFNGIRLGLCGKLASRKFRGRHYCGHHDPRRRHEKAQIRARHRASEMTIEIRIRKIRIEIDDRVAAHPDFRDLVRNLGTEEASLRQLQKKRPSNYLPPKGRRG